MPTVIAFLLCSVAWGASFLFIAVAGDGMSPFQVALGRIVLGAVTLALVMLVTRRRWPRDRRYWGHMLVLGVIFGPIPYLLFAFAGEHIPSGLSSIYNATTPITTLLISLIALPQERLTRTRAIAILVAALGVLVVAAPWELIGDPALAGSLPGQLACLAATTCYGIAGVYARRFISPFGYDATTIASSQIGVGAVLMLLVTPIFGLTAVDLRPDVVAAIIALGVVGTGFAYIWYYRVLDRWGATLASTVTYITPVVGVTLGILVLREQLHWNEPVGALIVIAGILVGQGWFSRRRPPAVGSAATSQGSPARS